MAHKCAKNISQSTVIENRPYHEKLSLALSRHFHMQETLPLYTSHSVLHVLVPTLCSVGAFMLTLGISNFEECFFPVFFSTEAMVWRRRDGVGHPFGVDTYSRKVPTLMALPYPLSTRDTLKSGSQI